MEIKALNLSETLKTFCKFADAPEKTRSELADELNVATAPNPDGNVQQPRTLSKRERNNRLRELFFTEIKNQCGGKIPNSVLDVMKLNDYGKVTMNNGEVTVAAFDTGKKLSHKRVKTVLDAVQNDLLKRNFNSEYRNLKTAAERQDAQGVLDCLQKITRLLFNQLQPPSKPEAIAALNDIAAEFVASARESNNRGGLEKSPRFCVALARLLTALSNTGKALKGNAAAESVRRFRSLAMNALKDVVLKNMDEKFLGMVYARTRECQGEDGVRTFLENHFNTVFGWDVNRDANGKRLELEARMKKVEDLVPDLANGDMDKRRQAVRKLTELYDDFAKKHIGSQADRDRLVNAFRKFVGKAFPSNNGTFTLTREQLVRLQSIADFSRGDPSLALENKDDNTRICSTQNFTLKLDEEGYKKLDEASRAQFRAATEDLKCFLLEISRQCDATTRQAILAALSENKGWISCKSAYKVFSLIKVKASNGDKLKIPVRSINPRKIDKQISLLDVITQQFAEDFVNKCASGDCSLTLTDRRKFDDYWKSYKAELAKFGSVDPCDDKVIRLHKQNISLLYCLSIANKMGFDQEAFWKSPFFMVNPGDAGNTAACFLEIAGKSDASAKLAARMLAYGGRAVCTAFLASMKSDSEIEDCSKKLSRALIYQKACPDVAIPQDVDAIPLPKFLQDGVEGAYDEKCEREMPMNYGGMKKTVFGGRNGLVLGPEIAGQYARGENFEFSKRDVKASSGVRFDGSVGFDTLLNAVTQAQGNSTDSEGKIIGQLNAGIGSLFGVFNDMVRQKVKVEFGDEKIDFSGKHGIDNGGDDQKAIFEALPKFKELCDKINKLNVRPEQKIAVVELLGQCALMPIANLRANDEGRRIWIYAENDGTVTVGTANSEQENPHFFLTFSIGKTGRNKLAEIHIKKTKPQGSEQDQEKRLPVNGLGKGANANGGNESPLRIDANDEDIDGVVMKEIYEEIEKDQPVIEGFKKTIKDKLIGNAKDVVEKAEDEPRTDEDYLANIINGDEAGDFRLAGYGRRILGALKEWEGKLAEGLGGDFDFTIRERCLRRVMTNLSTELEAELKGENHGDSPEEKIKAVFGNAADILEIIYSPEVARSEFIDRGVRVNFLAKQMLRADVCPENVGKLAEEFSLDKGKLIAAAASRLLSAQGDYFDTFYAIGRDAAKGNAGRIVPALKHLEDQLAALAGDDNVVSVQVKTTPLGKRLLREVFYDEKSFAADRPFHETDIARSFDNDPEMYRKVKNEYEGGAPQRLLDDIQNRYKDRLSLRQERLGKIAEEVVSKLTPPKDLAGVTHGWLADMWKRFATDACNEWDGKFLSELGDDGEGDPKEETAKAIDFVNGKLGERMVKDVECLVSAFSDGMTERKLELSLDDAFQRQMAELKTVSGRLAKVMSENLAAVIAGRIDAKDALDGDSARALFEKCYEDGFARLNLDQAKTYLADENRLVKFALALIGVKDGDEVRPRVKDEAVALVSERINAYVKSPNGKMFDTFVRELMSSEAVLAIRQKAARIDLVKLDSTDEAFRKAVDESVSALMDAYGSVVNGESCGRFILETWSQKATTDLMRENFRKDILEQLSSEVNAARDGAFDNNTSFALDGELKRCLDGMRSRIGGFAEKLKAVAGHIRRGIDAARWPERKDWPQGEILQPLLLSELMSQVQNWMRASVQGKGSTVEQWFGAMKFLSDGGDVLGDKIVAAIAGDKTNPNAGRSNAQKSAGVMDRMRDLLGGFFVKDN